MIQTFFISKEEIMDGIAEDFSQNLRKQSLKKGSLKVQNVEWSEAGINITIEMSKDFLNAQFK